MYSRAARIEERMTRVARKTSQVLGRVRAWKSPRSRDGRAGTGTVSMAGSSTSSIISATVVLVPASTTRTTGTVVVRSKSVHWGLVTKGNQQVQPCSPCD